MRGAAGVAAPVLIVAAALTVMVLGGMSLDLWRVVAEHQRLVGVSEGAALAGATALDTEALYRNEKEPLLDAEMAYGRACAYIATHGGPLCKQPGVSITIDESVISVELQSGVHLTLLRLAQLTSPEPVEVAVRSTATALRSG